MSPEQSLHDIQIPDVDRADLVCAARRFKLHRAFVRLTASALLVESLFTGAYKTPIAFEQLRLSSTEPQFIPVSQNPDHRDSVTTVIGGFGIKSSVPIAEALPQLGDLGAVEALDHDPTGIDSNVIAKKILAQATQNGVSEIGLWADSNGGLIASKVAKIIQQDDSAIRVRFIVLDCTPTSIDTLRPDKRQQVETLAWVNPILPGVVNHPLVEYIYTQQQMDSKTLAGGGFGIGEVIEQMNNPTKPSTALLAAQALLLADNTLRSDLRSVASVEYKDAPLLVTVRPKNDYADTTVISDKADEDIQTIVDETGFTHISLSLSDIIHGDPTANREQYQQAITDVLIPALLEYEAYLGVRVYPENRIK